MDPEYQVFWDLTVLDFDTGSVCTFTPKFWKNMVPQSPRLKDFGPSWQRSGFWVRIHADYVKGLQGIWTIRTNECGQLETSLSTYKFTRCKTPENRRLKSTWRVNLEVYGLIFFYVLADVETIVDRWPYVSKLWCTTSKRLISISISHYSQKALKLGKQYCPLDGSDIVQPY